MKKTNLVVTILVAIVCVIAGVFIFMPNNNTAFETQYNEIKNVEEYQSSSSYLDIDVKRSGEYVDFIFSDAQEYLYNVKLLIVPEHDSLRFSKTFLSVGIIEALPINILPKFQLEDPVDSNVNAIWREGLAASTKNKENTYLIYLEFDLYNGFKVKEYLKVEVE